MNKLEWTTSNESMFSCNCIGPQNGEPLCPCMMRQRGVYKKNGRWIEPEKDLGPVRYFDDDN